MQIEVNSQISLDEKEIVVEFIRASGPGGQHVNKVSTAVKLYFDIVHSPSLPDPVKEKLLKLGGKRVTDEGILVIDARRFRLQPQNREDAIARLVELIRKAAFVPKKRRPSRPTLASRERRLEGKKKRSSVKKIRQSKLEFD